MTLVLILKCIPGLQSQIIDFTYSFFQEDISSWDPVFVELPRYFKSDGGQYGAVIRLNESLYVQAKYVRLWYEKF